mmetsp:Transcript_52020/g.137417  ORF Transcript_52020/g.137417 Transcript_52020/m.137417 type:complete len:238 (-) Transcript_52020:150-863(-)
MVACQETVVLQQWGQGVPRPCGSGEEVRAGAVPARKASGARARARALPSRSRHGPRPRLQRGRRPRVVRREEGVLLQEVQQRMSDRGISTTSHRIRLRRVLRGSRAGAFGRPQLGHRLVRRQETLVLSARRQGLPGAPASRVRCPIRLQRLFRALGQRLDCPQGRLVLPARGQRLPGAGDSSRSRTCLKQVHPGLPPSQARLPSQTTARTGSPLSVTWFYTPHHSSRLPRVARCVNN